MGKVRDQLKNSRADTKSALAGQKTLQKSVRDLEHKLVAAAELSPEMQYFDTFAPEMQRLIMNAVVLERLTQKAARDIDRKYFEVAKSRQRMMEFIQQNHASGIANEEPCRGAGIATSMAAAVYEYDQAVGKGPEASAGPREKPENQFRATVGTEAAPNAKGTMLGPFKTREEVAAAMASYGLPDFPSTTPTEADKDHALEMVEAQLEAARLLFEEKDVAAAKHYSHKHSLVKQLLLSLAEEKAAAAARAKQLEANKAAEEEENERETDL